MKFQPKAGIMLAAVGVVALGVSAGSKSANADVSIQFGDTTNAYYHAQSGDAAAAFTGEWAQAGDANSGTTMDATTGDTIAFSANGGGAYNSYTTQGEFTSPIDGSNDSPLIGGYLFGYKAPLTATLSGFTGTDTYDIYLYGDGGGAGQGATFTINGASLSDTDPYTGGNLADGQSYVEFIDVAPTAGTITITDAADGTIYTPLNGIQVVDVPSNISAAPEPSQIGMLALIGFGLGGLLLSARRRSNTGLA